MFAGIAALIQGLVTGLASPISNYFIASKNNEGAEFASMNAAEQAEVIAYFHAQSDLNSAKVTNNQSRISHIMILLFGLPPAIYFGVFWISAGVPWLGWRVDPLKGDLGKELFDIGKTIALSFFIYGGAVTLGGPIVSSLASRLRGR